MTLTDILTAHRYKGRFFFGARDGVKAGVRDQCLCGHEGDHAAHVVEEMAAANIVAIELPESDEPDKFEWAATVFAAPGFDKVRCYLEDPRMTADDARELASALLAAAVRATPTPGETP